MKLPPALVAAAKARAKAITAAVTGGIAAYIVAAIQGGAPLTAAGLYGALGTALLAGLTVHQVTNVTRTASTVAAVANSRVPGSRGRLPVRAPGNRYPIKWLHEYLSAPLAAPTYPVDVTGGIPDNGWGMLGNGPDPSVPAPHEQGVGDCTFAGRQHLRYAKAAVAKVVEVWETAAALVAEYFAFTHGRDTGANMADLLMTWWKAGLIDGFAPVDLSDPAHVDAVMQEFGGLYVGVDLTDDAEQLFSEGRLWTLGSSSDGPDPQLGHCIVKVTADATTDGYVTWAHRQLATKTWSKACVQEAWAVLFKAEDGGRVDFPVLTADLAAAADSHVTPVSPTPVPAPTPTPTPAPTPVVVDAADRALAVELDHLAGLKTTSATARAAFTTWEKAKGLS